MTTNQPAGTARRQLLIDRFTELLETWGAPHAADRATQLRDVVDELGFALPAALVGDVPRPAASTAEGRAKARLLFAHRYIREPGPEGRCGCWEWTGTAEDHPAHLADVGVATNSDAPCAP